MAKNSMMSFWNTKRQEDERLQKVKLKKKQETAAKETSTAEQSPEKEKSE